jgi:hypothetical protein
MGLWEPLEKREAVLSVTINGRRIYFKNNAQYKVFRAACNKFKEAGMDLNDFLDSLPNVIKIKEDKDMSKKLVKLTEGDLRNIVKSSVNRILEVFHNANYQNDEDFEDFNNDYVPSANDFEDIEDNDFDLENYDGYYGYDNPGDYEGWMDDPIEDGEDFQFESKKRRGKVIKESDDDFNYDAYYRSLKGFLNNPIDINNGDYNPSDEEIMSAMGDLNLDDLDLDLPESKKRMGRIIRESINKVLNESGDDYPGNDWQDTYMDNKGNKIQSKGHGQNRKWRTVKNQEPKKQAKPFKNYPSNDWEDTYIDRKGNRIQSKGHGPNRKFRTIRKG